MLRQHADCYTPMHLIPAGAIPGSTYETDRCYCCRCLGGVAAAQPATDSTPGAGRSVGEATRDAASAVGRAAKAAVTPGDQDMGRKRNNRSGGLMGNDRTGTGSATTSSRRRPRADRG